MGALDYKTRRHRRNRLAAALAATYHPRRHFRLGQDVGWHWQFDNPNDLYRRRNWLTATNNLSAILLGNLTRTLGASTTPDGTSATRLTVTLNTTSTIANTGAAITSTAATARMFVTVKQVSGTPGARFLIRNSTTASDGDTITLNYTTGAVTGSGSITQGVSYSLGSGWWLLVLTRTTGMARGDGVIGYFGWLGDVAVTAGAAIDIAKVQLDFGDTTTTQAAVEAAYQPVPTTWAQAYLDAVGAERIYAWKDTAGTDPVTAVGEGIGLLLGREYGGVRGPTLLTNGSFATSANWSTDDPSVVVGSGNVTFTSSPNGKSAYQNLTGSLKANTLYDITFTVTGYVTGGVYTQFFAGANGPSVSANGTYTQKVKTPASIANSNFGFTSNGVTTLNVSVAAVREIPGTHITQATGTARPTLSARVNLLLNTEFAGAVAGTPGTAPTSWALTVAGGTTAVPGSGVLTLSATTGNRHFIAPSAGIVLVANAVYRLVVEVTAVSGPSPGEVVSINVTAGSASSTSSVTVANGVGRHTITVTAGAGGATIFLRIGAGVGGAVSADTSVSFRYPDLRTADDAAKNIPAYQRVGATASDHDTDGFPHYALADGTDDAWASVAPVDGSSTDKASFVVALTKNSDVASGTPIEFGPAVSATNGTFGARSSNTTGTTSDSYSVELRGTSGRQWRGTNGFAAPVTSVLTTSLDLSSNTFYSGLSFTVNGVSPTFVGIDNTAPGGGNFSTQTLYVLARAGTTTRFNGRFYGSTGRFGPMSDSERNNLTRWWQKRIGTA